MKAAVAGVLAESYHSELIDRIKADEYVYRHGRLTLHLAREFGFCYGVDRAVDYAYQTHKRFPEATVYLTGEIIHNPHVNAQLRGMGIGFLTDHPKRLDQLGPGDVVILPAFGVTMELLRRLEKRGCTLVDTTCGSVLNVWKNVRRYAERGYTSVIHGKVWHEETQATASQAVEHGGHFFVVFDEAETAIACDYIRHGGDRQAFLTRFAQAVSRGFDPDRDLARVGLANQTTMLMSESLRVADLFKAALTDRWGADTLTDHFQAFDTICSATQDRQDAVVALLERTPLDLMIVIGGYNSSNTCNLARICATRYPTYHVADPDCLLSPTQIRHRPVGTKVEVIGQGWLLGPGPVTVGLTSGASTPDNLMGQVVSRLSAFCDASSGDAVTP
jgi:4-hydroxy-3-methylbut-2-enyl diphosphate reductase